MSFTLKNIRPTVLLETSSSEFAKQLFDVDVPDPPNSVECEAYLPESSGPDRFADILVFHKERAISIEVKQGDTAYEKTRHTAALVERHYDYDWKHVLLLPADRVPIVRRTFLDLVDEGDRPEIPSAQSGPIQVLHWRDVSEALRSELLSDQDLDPHWEASAYLLCTLIEQRIIGCNSVSEVTEMTEAGNIIGISQIVSATNRLDNQISYLEEVIRAHE